MIFNHLSSSELILNSDGSVYHLKLKPSEIANNIITVGDPDRVAMVSNKFDHIEVKKQCREFVTHTGQFRGKRITVISTGIGTDNIDIVLNELDALVNIDLEKKTIKKDLTSLNIFRIGTSGALQPNIDVDRILLSQAAVGFDGLMNFYWDKDQRYHPFTEALAQHFQHQIPTPYFAKADENLLKNLINYAPFLQGVTLTMPGFYAPQGRTIRYNNALRDNILDLPNFTFQDLKLTNIEMETSGIYGLATVLGHKAISINAILANRTNNIFSTQAEKTIDKAIDTTLNFIAEQ